MMQLKWRMTVLIMILVARCRRQKEQTSLSKATTTTLDKSRVKDLITLTKTSKLKPLLNNIRQIIFLMLYQLSSTSSLHLVLSFRDHLVIKFRFQAVLNLPLIDLSLPAVREVKVVKCDSINLKVIIKYLIII